MSLPNSSVSRSATQLYRDCLRLVLHIAGKSKKGNQLKKIVCNEFRKNAKLEDVVKIEALKANAVRGLANYLMLESASKDEKLRDRTSSYVSREANSIKKTV